MACEGIHASLAKKAYGFICQSSALLEVISVLHKHGRVLSQRLSERGRSMPDTVYVGLASRISRLEHTRPCWLGRGGGHIGRRAAAVHARMSQHDLSRGLRNILHSFNLVQLTRSQ